MADDTDDEVLEFTVLLPPARRDVGHLDHDQFARFEPDEIDRALWEIAVAGGNVVKAHQSLSEWCGSQDPPVRAPSRRAMGHWKKGPYRNRYHEILQHRAKDIQEVLAQGDLELALRQQEVERDALKQVAARIGGLDAVDASTVLRNVSQSKKIQVEGALNLRGQSAGHMQAASLKQLANSLKALGVAEVIDGEFVEEEGGSPPLLPTGD